MIKTSESEQMEGAGTKKGEKFVLNDETSNTGAN